MIFFVLLLLQPCLLLNPERLRLVDKNLTTNNFLIRGDFPGSYIDSHTFVDDLDYEIWKEEMKILIDIKTGVKLTDFFIIDISLLHSYGRDLEMVHAEEDFFKKHPDRGLFIHHEINGTDQNATQLSPESRAAKLATFPSWDEDQLSELMALVRMYLSTPGAQGKPVVIYWHCAGGVDRTGETSGSYYMQFLGWTMKRSYDYDTEVKGGRLMGSRNGNMMNWLCYWLEMKKIQTNLNCDVW